MKSWTTLSFFKSFLKWKVKYCFVKTLCNLLVYNCDISPSHDKYRCLPGSIAYSYLDPVNGSHIGYSGRMSPLWDELIFVTHLICGAGTVQIAFAHPQNLQTTPLSLALQFVHIFLLYFISRMAFLGRYEGLIRKW